MNFPLLRVAHSRCTDRVCLLAEHVPVDDARHACQARRALPVLQAGPLHEPHQPARVHGTRVCFVCPCYVCNESPRLILWYLLRCVLALACCAAQNVELLHRYINERGMITNKSVNGNCSKHQRKIARAIKQVRRSVGGLIRDACVQPVALLILSLSSSIALSNL